MSGFIATLMPISDVSASYHLLKPSTPYDWKVESSLCDCRNQNLKLHNPPPAAAAVRRNREMLNDDSDKSKPYSQDDLHHSLPDNHAVLCGIILTRAANRSTAQSPYLKILPANVLKIVITDSIWIKKKSAKL